MPAKLLLLPLILIACCPSFAAGSASPNFDPENWPGRIQPDQELKSLVDALGKAVEQCDKDKIAELKTTLIQKMGRYAGVPEKRPEYHGPADASEPDIDEVAALWRASFQRMQGSNGWDLAAPHDAEFQTGPRLRVSARSARAYLYSYEAQREDAHEAQREDAHEAQREDAHEAQREDAHSYLGCALEGFDYIVGAQCSTGVFGYPYAPKGSGLKQAGARIVERGQREGRTMVENGWIIDDLGDGGLNFDNGVCGTGLLEAYRVTGNQQYLESARRAAEWAIRRPLVLNWNYNSFSGWLLANLYRATSDKRYLNEATRIFKYGVLPGQMSNGRWFDQHNARIQYHSVILRSLIDFHRALKQAADPYADTVKDHAVLGLDNLAAQIATYGVSNVHELLSLDALCMGLSVFGDHPRWKQAVNVNINGLCDRFLPELEKRGMPMTETVAVYLRYQRRDAGKTSARSQAGSHIAHP